MSRLKMEVRLFVSGHVTYNEEEAYRIKEQDNRSLSGDPHKPWDMVNNLLYFTNCQADTEII
jgi:hypothetical protein